MQIAIIGLGRMGFNIALHLLEQGVDVVAYNRSSEKIEDLKFQISNSKFQINSKSQNPNLKRGEVTGAYSIAEIPVKLTSEPKIVFLYVPAGAVTDEMIFGSPVSSPTPIGDPENKELDSRLRGNDKKQGLVDILPKGSIIVDGGNSFWEDSQRRFLKLKEKGLHFLDMGTSGGLEGARNGACLMVGGEKEMYEQVKPILALIACKDGYGYFGPSGAGHFVKMVHNAVEYGMMGSIAEGFNLIFNFQFSIFNKTDTKEKQNNFQIDLAEVAKVWAHGSIVSGLLMNKAESAFAKNPTLDDIEGLVPRGETEAEMEWINETGIPNPVIQQSRLQRVETRSKPSFIGKVVAALRREFGGHGVKEVSSN